MLGKNITTTEIVVGRDLTTFGTAQILSIYTRVLSARFVLKQLSDLFKRARTEICQIIISDVNIKIRAQYYQKYLLYFRPEFSTSLYIKCLVPFSLGRGKLGFNRQPFWIYTNRRRRCERLRCIALSRHISRALVIRQWFDQWIFQSCKAY